MDSLLPPEIWQHILGYLPRKDLIAFSTISIRLRSLALPDLFRSMKASNATKSFQGLTDFLYKHGHKVTKLRLECHLTPNDPESEEIPSYDMPQEILDLLKGRHLPNNQTTELEFMPYEEFGGPEDGWDDSGMGSVYIHEEPEEKEAIAEAELEYQWRRNIYNVFDALTQNNQIKTLLIRRLIPRLCSVFFNPEWRAFLGRLTNLELGLWAGDNGAGWQSNTLNGYNDFIRQLQSCFFNGLERVTRLKFVSDSENPIGCEGYNHSPLPLFPDNLPQLEILELENFFIDPALLTFLGSKASSLKILRFKECFAATQGQLAENPISWAEFLSQLCSMQPSYLSEMSLVNDRVPLSRKERYPEARNYDRSAEAEDLKEIRSKMEKDNTRRLFSYKYLDDKYGMCFDHIEQNIKSFKEGEDQSAYNRLMELLAANGEDKNNVEAM